VKKVFVDFFEKNVDKSGKEEYNKGIPDENNTNPILNG